jgi:Flp pilus assembly protein TadD
MCTCSGSPRRRRTKLYGHSPLRSATLDHSRSQEQICLLPTKLDPAAEDSAGRPCIQGVEEAEEERCWVCLEGEEGGPLVQLCACRGTAKWAHKACVDDWRRKSDKADAAYRCGQCKDEYRDALSLELLSARLQAERTDGRATRLTLVTLAFELEAQGKYDEAEPLLREALEVSRETLGNRHPDTLTSISNLGALLYAKGNLAAAEPLIREALEVQRETVGDRHPDTLVYINNLGGLLLAKGDLAAAESLYREALEGRRETLGNRHPDTLTSINNLCMLLQAKGDLAAAEPLLREVIEGLRATLGSGHPDTLACIAKLRRLIIIRRWPGSTYTYIASCSRRSLYLVSVTLASCSAACFAMICTYYIS